MAVCITTYTLASGLIQQGMNWWQATLTILLGNVIVLIPMMLNAHPGTKYGIPFPVLLRAPFGTFGSNIPALMRGLVACGWFGIQTWVGGAAIHATAAVILRSFFDIDLTGGAPLPWLGITASQFTCFMIFWAANVWFIVCGMESIKWLEALAAPFLLVVGVGLLEWAWYAADGFGPIFSQPSKFTTSAEFWPVFGAGLTAMIGYSALLGPIAGIMIADYFLWRRTHLDVDGLYRQDGPYRYVAGFSVVGFGCLLAAVLPNVPGFLTTIEAVPPEMFPTWLVAGYHYAWFIGFALGFVLYGVVRPNFPDR
jgi:cytosine/uracil/thiamine/allantoin permease